MIIPSNEIVMNVIIFFSHFLIFGTPKDFLGSPQHREVRRPHDLIHLRVYPVVL